MNLKTEILIFTCMTTAQELKLCEKMAWFDFLGQFGPFLHKNFIISIETWKQLMVQMVSLYSICHGETLRTPIWVFLAH